MTKSGRETWHNVQRLRETKRRAPKTQNAPNRLTGLLYCAECGAKLTHRRNLVQGKWWDDAFICGNYRQLTRGCTMHYIPTQKLEAAVLSTLAWVGLMNACRAQADEIVKFELV